MHSEGRKAENEAKANLESAREMEGSVQELCIEQTNGAECHEHGKLLSGSKTIH